MRNKKKIIIIIKETCNICIYIYKLLIKIKKKHEIIGSKQVH